MATVNDNLITITKKITRLEKANSKRQGQDGGGYWMSMNAYNVLSPLSVTGFPYIATIPRDMILRRFVMNTFVATTSNSSNYWTLTFDVLGGNRLTFDTKTDTANTWTRHTSTTFVNATITAASDTYFLLTATKTGSPGNFSASAPILFFI
jgi:hypothetical protein